MSEDSLNYESQTVVNVFPDAIDLSKEIKYSSYVKARQYTEIFPVTQPPAAYSAGNIGSSVRILLTDPARWLDKKSATLQMQIGGLVVPAASRGSYAILDGPISMISRCNVYVGGQQINSGTVNHLNKITAAVEMNKGSIATYCSDDSALTGGCEKLRSVLLSGDTPTTESFYHALANSPYNFLPLKGADNNTITAPAYATDALGFITYDASRQASGNNVNGYGYSNSASVNSGSQVISIPLSLLHPFFDSYEMLPLFLTKEVVIELFFATPVETFVSDICSGPDAAGTAPVAGPAPAGAAGVPGTKSTITSYSVTNLKLCCDLVNCADEVNDTYKMKAASSEGLMIMYDDYAVGQKPATWTNGGPQQHQAILSTSNLKSMLFFRQSDLVASSQSGFSNTNYMYLGIQNFTCTINNTNMPPNPLSAPQSILAYNMRSRGAIHNQLSNCVANNPYVFYRAETIPTPSLAPAAGAPSVGPDTLLLDLPASITSFMIYNNFEKIHEDIQVANGVSLASAGSMLTVKFTEDVNVGPDNIAAKKAAAILGPALTYNMYAVMTYGKTLVFANGGIQVLG